MLWRGAASEIVRLALCQLLLPINYFTIQLVAPFSSDRQRGVRQMGGSKNSVLEFCHSEM